MKERILHYTTTKESGKWAYQFHHDNKPYTVGSRLELSQTANALGYTHTAQSSYEATPTRKVANQ